MFSYLRPHRRTSSNPASPIPDQLHSWESPLHATLDQHAQPPAAVSRPSGESRTLHQSPAVGAGGSPASPMPLLPEIARVSSLDFEPPMRHPGDGGSQELVPRLHDIAKEVRSQRDASAGIRQGDTRETEQRLGFRSKDAYRAASYTTDPSTSTIISQQSPEERRTAEASPKTANSAASSNTNSLGRRPAGTRMPTPPSEHTVTLSSTFESHPPRSGKTRLNLLNPMSLLARRRSAQVVSQVAPFPTQHELQPSKTFDPRIRGTKVHDFSAPRTRRNQSYNDVAHAAQEESQSSSRTGKDVGDGFRAQDEGVRGSWCGGPHTPAFTEDFDDEQYPAAGPHVRRASDLSDLTLPKLPFAPRPKDVPQYSSRDARQSTSRDVPQSAPRDVVQSFIATSLSTATATIPVTATELTGMKAQAIGNNDRTGTIRVDADKSLPVLPKLDESVELQSDADLASGSTTSPDETPSSVKTRSRNASQTYMDGPVLKALPKHMKSTSSRFSFDMTGAAKQEKLLEDRHRQKELEKRSSRDVDDGEEDDNEDDNYDDMDDDDGLEERIPGVNADAYEDEENDDFEGAAPTYTQPHDNFTFHNMNYSIQGVDTKVEDDLGTGDMPRDRYSPEHALPVDVSNPMPEIESRARLALDGKFQDSRDRPLQGLAIQDIALLDDRFADASPESAPSDLHNEDDLYFDDGIIDEANDEPAEFDESVFDNEDTDEYGRPLRPLSSLPTLYSPPFIVVDQPEKGSTAEHDHFDSRSQDQVQRASITSQQSLDVRRSLSTESQSTAVQGPSLSLTHASLTAYQTALAAAAIEAAEAGKFHRDDSPVLDYDGRDGHGQFRTLNDPGEEQEGDDEVAADFDFDDALEDDAIIAEANAEALANDREGFYGQEFGFYSAPAANEGEFVNGGYFGPRGEGLKRSQSGRNVSREPNLTPITERSEYSNRNSLLSLPASATGFGSNLPTTSLGLAQLASSMGAWDEENMSFGALLKMRRGAWGGSQASAPSSVGHGSPMSAIADDFSQPAGSGGQQVWPVPVPPPVSVSSGRNGVGHVRNSSGYSVGAVSDASSTAASPVVMMAMGRDASGIGAAAPAAVLSVSTSPSPSAAAAAAAAAAALAATQAMPPPPLPMPSSSLLASFHSRPLSPTKKRASAVGLVSFEDDGRETAFGRQGRSHRHTGSADSISYVQEDDPSGEGGQRWVLERRRTGEGGEVEILGRMVVSGGRI